MKDFLYAISATMLFLLAGQPAVSADEEGDIVDAMRANDERFDDIVLHHKRSWDGVLKSDSFDMTEFDDDPSTMPADYWEPVPYKGLANETLIVRGSHRVLAVDFDKSMANADKYQRIGTGYSRTGDFGDVVYRLDDMQLPDDSPGKGWPNYEKQLRIEPYKFPLGALYDELLAREFAHGIGFGRRIMEVTSQEKCQAGQRLQGRIKIWTEDVSRFEIEVDADGLVRKAQIDCDVHGNWTRFEVTSYGKVEKEDLKLAQRGHYRRLRMPRVDGKEGEPSVAHDYHLELVSVETNIDAMQFEELSRFEQEPLMQYNNEIQDLHGTGVGLDNGKVGIRLRDRTILREVPDDRGLETEF